MAIDFAGTGRKITENASHINLEILQKFSVHFKVRLPNITDTYTRIIQIRDGDQGFAFTQHLGNIYVAGVHPTFLTYGGNNISGSMAYHAVSENTLTTGVWSTVTHVFKNDAHSGTLDANFFCSVGSESGGGFLRVDGGLSQKSGLSALGTGDNVDQICFGSRCRTGTTTQSEFNGDVAEFAIWENYELTANDRLALENGVSPRSIAPHRLKSYIPLQQIDALHDVLTRKAVTSSGTVAPVTSNVHPSTNDPVGANLVTSDQVAVGPLVVLDATSTGAIDAVAVTVDANLIVGDLTSTGAVDPVAITVDANLTVDDAVSTGAIDTLALTIDANLALQDTTSTGAIDTVAITVDGNLTVADNSSTGAIDSVSVTVDANLQVGDLTSTGEIDTASVTITGNLVLGDLTSTGFIDLIALDIEGDLLVEDPTSTGEIDPVAVTTTHNLSVMDATATGTIDAVSLIVTQALSVVDSVGTGEIDPVQVQVTINLVLEDASATGEIDTVEFFQQIMLALKELEVDPHIVCVETLGNRPIEIDVITC